MKRTTVIFLIAVLAVPLIADDGAATYKAKCAMCHGPDGKKLAKADLSGATVQAKSDADLIAFVATDKKHNFKGKGLSEEQIKGVVGYLRTLKK